MIQSNETGRLEYEKTRVIKSQDDRMMASLRVSGQKGCKKAALTFAFLHLNVYIRANKYATRKLGIRKLDMNGVNSWYWICAYICWLQSTTLHFMYARRYIYVRDANGKEMTGASGRLRTSVVSGVHGDFKSQEFTVLEYGGCFQK